MDVGTCVYFELFDQVPEKLKKLRQMGFTSCQLISWVPETYTLDKADTMKKWLEKYGITFCPVVRLRRPSSMGFL